jgi:hypothetical protein
MSLTFQFIRFQMQNTLKYGNNSYHVHAILIALYITVTLAAATIEL